MVERSDICLRYCLQFSICGLTTTFDTAQPVTLAGERVHEALKPIEVTRRLTESSSATHCSSGHSDARHRRSGRSLRTGEPQGGVARLQLPKWGRVSRASREYWRCATVRKMKEDPSGSVIRNRSQATAAALMSMEVRIPRVLWQLRRASKTRKREIRSQQRLEKIRAEWNELPSKSHSRRRAWLFNCRLRDSGALQSAAKNKEASTVRVSIRKASVRQECRSIFNDPSVH